jgi:hypothetical protein
MLILKVRIRILGSGKIKNKNKNTDPEHWLGEGEEYRLVPGGRDACFSG